MITVVEAIAQHARNTPDKIAVICGDAELSYHELWRRAQAVAAALGDRGVCPESIVALYGAATAEFVTAGLGTWLAGAAWVPIDPQLPAERVRFTLADTDAAVVIRTGGRGEFDGAAEVADLVREGQGRQVNDRPYRERLAYVIYTSGSTGVPKGVMVEHGPLGIHLDGVAGAYRMSASDTAVNFSSPSFDAAVEEVWLPLFVGGTVVLRGAAIWTGPQLFARVAKHQASHVLCPTSFFEAFFSEKLSERDIAALSSLRHVIFGGEAVSANTVRTWANGPLAAVTIYNTYGPTEAVITATSYPIAAGWDGGDRVSIGSALAGHELLVIDEHGAEATTGELYLGGPCLAKGYLGRDELTAERFVRLPRGRFYRTGDRVSVVDGELIFLGRLDRQVKLRGFRIELDEIETVLSGIDGVRGAIVLLNENPRPRLTACVVLRGVDRVHVREQLKQRLPHYMVPDEIEVLDELPLNATGKIDRARVLAEVTG
jgi:amino acid adenylation domain-containing protein